MAGIGAIVLLLVALMPLLAQEATWLRVVGVDTTGFPHVRVSLIAGDVQSAPLSDLAGLSIRENGIPVGDLQFERVPAGIDVVFVIDANESLDQIDDASGLSRRQKVQASIGRFATIFMTDGLDRVSVLVPDAADPPGRWLVLNESNQAAVAAAIEAYDSATLAETPLNDLLITALGQLASTSDSRRFQTIMLMTDGASLDEQLDFDLLAARAQTQSVPIYSAILGARADADEVANVSRLFEPTRATFVHMPVSTDADVIYEWWQGQSAQWQIDFRSLQSRSGRYPIALTLGESQVTAEYELVIEPPFVSISIIDPVIRRSGQAPDTPLANLTPTSLPVSIGVTWTGGLRRRVTAVSLLVNGEARATRSGLTLDEAGRLELVWDLRSLDAGDYSVQAAVTDEYGLSATSEPLRVTIVVDRPQPPTVTPVATSPPRTETLQPAIPFGLSRVTWSAFLLLIALLALLLLTLRRVRGRRNELEVAASEASQVQPAEPETPSGGEMVAFLEPLADMPGQPKFLPLESETVIIGRDPQQADLVLSDRSISSFHASIRRRGEVYWLYDEGGASGTYYNYERLGLAPQQLRDNDTIHAGQVGLRFRLRPWVDLARFEEEE